MGCDIHVHAEVKINGKWEHFEAPGVSRNYQLFAKMAGVRNYRDEVSPIAEPRGLPEDVTGITKFDSDNWDSDGHSHSYLTSEEIAHLESWAVLDNVETEIFPLFSDGWLGELYNESYGAFYSKPHLRPEGVEDFRIVFWFDN